MKKSKIYIGCCGAYCEKCKAFVDKSCKGCKIGYDTKERDINKAKCKIKLCCFRDKKLDTCADCDQFSNCKIFNNKFKIGTRDNKKCQESLNFIKNEGYDKFLLKTKNWKSHIGKLK